MIKAKKSLGQNFLVDNNIIDKIINSADVYNKNILEIGPGPGYFAKNWLSENNNKYFVL